ncbi:MAG: response regulator [Sediminibacterium sp.]|nr:response regulator [Sediminibacterium sp.]
MQRSIMIIDDEVDECMLLANYLRKKGFQVDFAHTLTEGIDILRLGIPDYLLLDNHLPDGPGWKYAGLIRGLFPQLAITLITGGETEGTPNKEDTFMRLTKPLSFKDLDVLLK